MPSAALAWINANPEHPSAAVVAAGTAKALMNLGRQTEAAALVSTIRNQDVLRWLDAP